MVFKLPFTSLIESKKLFHIVDCFSDVMYPYGEQQKDKEMDVEMIRAKLCERIGIEDGVWFFDNKHYKLFVSFIEKNQCSVSLF